MHFEYVCVCVCVCDAEPLKLTLKSQMILVTLVVHVKVHKLNKTCLSSGTPSF